MKNTELDLVARLFAFEEFLPEFLCEKNLEDNIFSAFDDPDMAELAAEESALATVALELCREIQVSTDGDEIGVKIKVLAELVEDMFNKEECEVLPSVVNTTPIEKLDHVIRDCGLSEMRQLALH